MNKIKLTKPQPKQTKNGLKFTTILALIFITLKLCGVINWSWIWVLAPLWFIPSICLMIVLIMMLLVGFAELFLK